MIRPEPAENGEPILRLEGVEKAFEGKKALDGITLDIPRRQITAIIGLSGSGKSVMIKHMIGLLRPDRGIVMVDGVDINGLSKKKLYEIRKQFGMLFQSGALFDSLNVFDNVAFPLREKTKMGEEKIREKVLGILRSVGLEDASEKYPDEVSGGMLRRVALARAIIMDPEILLFDEPTTGLDPIIRNSILSLICRTYNEHRFTMVMVSHDIPDIFQWCHHVVVAHKGKIIEVGSPEEVMNSTNSLVRQLVDGAVSGPIQLE
ncbi:MAG: ATP-binding cassette domain-containing protein [Syntrophorhabdaceae bacterium]|nr:ATP-binding cassette domain-containing protein [Syntrophorhabdaceae bacterium]